MGAAGAGLKRQQWFAEMSGPRGAAFDATVLMLLQDCPLDVANFYTGEIQGFGLFNFNGVPQKNYYAFKAFRELLNTPLRLSLPTAAPGQVTVCAGLAPDGKSAALLAANFNAPEERLAVRLQNPPWAGATAFEVLRLDSARDLVPVEKGSVPSGSPIELAGFEAPAVLLIGLRLAGSP
jgi:xylan 1,4-beta-xylosidase